MRLDEVVFRTLEKEPDRRYQQASQIRTDMDTIRNTRLATVSDEKKSRARSWTVGWIAIGVLIGVLGVLLIPVAGRSLAYRHHDVSEDSAGQNNRVLQPTATPSHFSAGDGRVYVLPQTPGSSVTTVPPIDPSSVLPQPPQGPGNQNGGRVTLLNEKAGVDGSKRSQVPAQEFSGGGMYFEDPIWPTENSGGASERVTGNAASLDDSRSILWGDSGPTINSAVFDLPADHVTKINDILKTTHENYLKLEAQHSIVSVDDAGKQVTKISVFDVSSLENDFWTQIDDAVSIVGQKQLRDQLSLYANEAHRTTSPTDIREPLPDMPETRPTESHSESLTDAPGILGFGRAPEIMISVARSGRWFRWRVIGRGSGGTHTAPELPQQLKRFFRPPGPWMALAEVQSAFPAEDWNRLSNAFTCRGQFELYLATALQDNFSGETSVRDPENDLETFRSSALLTEMCQQAANVYAALPEETRAKHELLMTRIRLAESDDALSQLTREAANVLPKEFVRATFLLAIAWDEHTNKSLKTFFLHGMETSVDESGIGRGTFHAGSENNPTPVRFVNQDGWKIDGWGTEDQIRSELHRRHLDDRKKMPTQSARLADLRDGLIAGRFSMVTEVLTEDARDEWIGEMFVAAGAQAGFSNLVNRYSAENTSQPDPVSAELLGNLLAHDAAWKEKVETLLKEPGIGDVLSNSSAEPVARRAACIRLAGTMENRAELLVKLLESRTRNNPDALVSFGSLENIENGSDPETRRSADWHWKHKSAPDLKIEFLNSSGHWKINTILDPALKP